MPSATLFDSNGNRDRENEKNRPPFASGIVLDNCDLPVQGKVRVRIPVLDQEVWARVATTGAGSSRGIMYIPQADDEVLVGLNYGDLTDCYIVGSVWNTSNRMPAELPTDVMTRRVIRTGLTEATGHEVEFDDALQSITITTSTEQKITLDPEKIEVSTTSGSVKITLDLSTQSVAIEAPNEIKLKALKSIKLEAAKIDIQGTATTTIKGGMVNIN